MTISKTEIFTGSKSERSGADCVVCQGLDNGIEPLDLLGMRWGESQTFERAIRKLRRGGHGKRIGGRSFRFRGF